MEKDDYLRWRTIIELRDFGILYVKQISILPAEYMKGHGFNTAVKAASGIGPALGQVLKRKDISTSIEPGQSSSIISKAIQCLIDLDLFDQIPPNFVEELKNDPRFSSEKDQDSTLYLERKIKEAREK